MSITGPSHESQCDHRYERKRASRRPDVRNGLRHAYARLPLHWFEPSDIADEIGAGLIDEQSAFAIVAQAGEGQLAAIELAAGPIIFRCAPKDFRFNLQVPCQFWANA